MSAWDFTCIALRNQRGSDSALDAVPVHLSCWEGEGARQGYTRVKGAKQFVPYGTRTLAGPSLPLNTVCYLCRNPI